jgi:hypothetical protein
MEGMQAGSESNQKADRSRNDGRQIFLLASYQI